jgi:CheY-like chemotaxis protein
LARKILLADDSVTAQNMGRRILSDAGYDVSTVNNGSAALKRIAESKPDLIVLDVYMPGYGGLEVCQRLRESPETARIPVLLTVGKLEPFKADEARRVRADGFIVKPFEASELLTALTKLEDKIVPQSQPAKPGRFAKALASVDEFTPAKEFGDSETGWKSRLSIPPPHAKHREPAPEEPSAAIASLRESVKAEEGKSEHSEMKSGLEEALLSSMPQDVTAEEIAAIKAAAAAFSAPSDESTFLPRPPREQSEVSHDERVVQSPDSETPAAKSEEPEPVASVEQASGGVTFASGSQEAEPVVEAIVEAQTESATPSNDAIVEPALSDDTAASTANTVSEEPAAVALPDAIVEAAKLGDEEVTAALASLAPANGNGDAAGSDREQVAVTIAATVATQQFNGPRWIAEPVALLDDEATLALEQEMERAYAAFAAADAARMSFGEAPRDGQSFTANDEVPAGASPPVAESISNSDGSEQGPRESMAGAEAEVTVEVTNPPTSSPSENAPAEVTETAAYAAAASANSGMEATVTAEAFSQPGLRDESSENTAAPENSGRQSESELAAAWANWRQIRESVIGSQLTSQIADSIADLQDTHCEPATPESDSQPEAAAAGDDSSEISNIVDSVLADLKPKLMEEIAKKMGKEKKKK